MAKDFLDIELQEESVVITYKTYHVALFANGHVATVLVDFNSEITVSNIDEFKQKAILNLSKETGRDVSVAKPYIISWQPITNI